MQKTLNKTNEDSNPSVHIKIDQFNIKTPEIREPLQNLIKIVENKDVKTQNYIKRQIERYLNDISTMPMDVQISRLNDIFNIQQNNPQLKLSCVISLYQSIEIDNPSFSDMSIDDKTKKILKMKNVLGENYGIDGARWSSIPPEYLLSTYNNHFEQDKKNITLVLISSSDADIETVDMIGIGLFGVLRPVVNPKDVIVCVARTDEEVAVRINNKGKLSGVTDDQRENSVNNIIGVNHSRAEGGLYGPMPEEYMKTRNLDDNYQEIDKSIFDTGDLNEGKYLKKGSWSKTLTEDCGIYFIACAMGGEAKARIKNIEQFGNSARFVATLADREVHAATIPISPSVRMTKKDDGHYSISYKKKNAYGDKIEYFKVFQPPHFEYFPNLDGSHMVGYEKPKNWLNKIVKRAIKSARRITKLKFGHKTFGFQVSEKNELTAFANTSYKTIELKNNLGETLSEHNIENSKNNKLSILNNLDDGIYSIVFTRKNNKKPKVLQIGIINGDIYHKGKMIKSKV